MKKKIFAALLAVAMLLSLCACNRKTETPASDATGFTMGLVDNVFDFREFGEHRQENHSEKAQPAEHLIYPNLSTAMLALEKGEVTMISMCKPIADYLVAHNDKFAIDEAFNAGENVNYFSMLTADNNTEIYEILDKGIKQLKENGTLDKLIEEDLKAYITSDPTPAKLPKFDGAKTYKIAVTGDRPPMDFVTADGKAAGFNVALLSEIANIAQVNFEIVHIDSEARLTALASGAVDAVFWVVSIRCLECDVMIGVAPEGTLMTEEYFSDYSSFIRLK